MLLRAGKRGELGGHSSVFVTTGMDFEAAAAYLDEQVGSGGVVTMVCDEGLHRFMEFDLGKNDPKGPYYVREFETQMIGMASVREFVQCARAWRKQRVFLSLKGEEARVVSLVERVVDWEALEGILASQRLTAIRESMRLEMGTKNGVLPARYATRDQLLIQVRIVVRCLVETLRERLYCL